MIASSGVSSPLHAQAMLAAGALAAETDIGLWIPSPNEKSPVK
jgi:hypothetical protein